MEKKKDNYISSTNFKQHFLQYVKDINNNKNSFVITKRDKPIAKISPIDIDNKKLSTCFGVMKGTIKINDDIVNFSTESEWEVSNE